MKLCWSVLLSEGLTVVCLDSEQEDVDDWKLCTVQAVLMLPPFIHEKNFSFDICLWSRLSQCQTYIISLCFFHWRFNSGIAVEYTCTQKLWLQAQPHIYHQIHRYVDNMSAVLVRKWFWIKAYHFFKWPSFVPKSMNHLVLFQFKEKLVVFNYFCLWKALFVLKK